MHIFTNWDNKNALISKLYINFTVQTCSVLWFTFRFSIFKEKNLYYFHLDILHEWLFLMFEQKIMYDD